MEIRQLRYFLAIAQTEHLTQAARSLYITQSTLSHGLRQLEEELGVQLFERIGRRLKLSVAGESFRTHAGRALQELEAGRMALSDLSGLRSGFLNLGVIPTFLNTLVPAAVAAFSEAYPGVHVVVRDLRALEIEERLAAGELDLGLAFWPTSTDDIDCQPLFTEKLQLLVSPRHPLAKRTRLPIKALAGQALALLTVEFATRRKVDEALRAAGVTPHIPVEMESVEALIDVCRHSRLASIVPERAAQLAPDMHALDLTAPALKRQAGILWRRGGSPSMAAQAFAHMLTLRLGER